MSGYQIIRDGADVDASGVIHLAVGKESSPEACYARSDTGWVPSTITGLTPGYMTCAVDDDGKLHVTSAVHLHDRFYATNAGGTFDVVAVSSSNTAPAAILAAPGLPVTIAYNHWSSRQIRVTNAADWGQQTLLHQYVFDNGPGLALKTRDGARRSPITRARTLRRTSAFKRTRPGRGSSRPLRHKSRPRTRSISPSIRRATTMS